MKKITLGNEVYTYTKFSELEEPLKKFKISIGKKTIIGNNVTIGVNVIIGEDCRILNKVLIFNNVRIGRKTYIGTGAVLMSYANIENHVSIFPEVVISSTIRIPSYVRIEQGHRPIQLTYIGNGYKYATCSYQDAHTDEWYIQMGCKTKTLAEWKNNFWDNDEEFPNNDSDQSIGRDFAFRRHMACIELNIEEEKKINWRCYDSNEESL